MNSQARSTRLQASTERARRLLLRAQAARQESRDLVEQARELGSPFFCTQCGAVLESAEFSVCPKCDETGNQPHH
jgi:rubrerythrin